MNSVPDCSSLDIPLDADLQREPLFQLLESSALEDKRSCDGKDVHFLVVCNCNPVLMCDVLLDLLMYRFRVKNISDAVIYTHDFISENRSKC